MNGRFPPPANVPGGYARSDANGNFSGLSTTARRGRVASFHDQLVRNEDFAYATNTYTGLSNCTLALDTTNVRTGYQSLKMTLTGSNGVCYRQGVWTPVVDGTVSGRFIRFRHFVPPAFSGSVIRMYLYDSNNHYGQVNLSLAPGWHTLDVPVPQTGGASYDPSILAGFSPQIIGSAGDYVVFDAIQFIDALDVPTFVFTFDDFYYEDYQAAAYLERYGWMGAFSLATNLLAAGASAGQHVNLQQVLDLDARGHLIINHTANHLNWGTLNDAQVVYEVATGRNFLLRNGLGRGADVLVIPYGWYGDAARVQAIAPYTSCILNTSQLAWDGPVYDAGSAYTGWSGTDRRTLFRSLTNNLFTTAAVDAVIAAKATTGILTHQLDQTGMLSTAAWRTAVDYVAAKEAAGLCRVLSLEEWLNNE